MVKMIDNLLIILIKKKKLSALSALVLLILVNKEDNDFIQVKKSRICTRDFDKRLIYIRLLNVIRVSDNPDFVPVIYLISGPFPGSGTSNHPL